MLTYVLFAFLQKSKNTKSGSEMQRDKEAVAAMMREKQKKGTRYWPISLYILKKKHQAKTDPMLDKRADQVTLSIADEKRAAEAKK